MAVAALLFGAAVGCGDDGKRKSPSTATCQTDDDCAEGTVCRDDVCREFCSSHEDCPGDSHCRDDSCLPDVCEAGATSCSSTGNAILVCTEAGDAFDLTRCGAGRRCVEEDDGAQCRVDDSDCMGDDCPATECEPGARRCEGHSIATCSAGGDEEKLEPCGDGARCDAESAQCVELVCEPESAGCVAETLATCNEEGTAFEPTGEDCAESDLACWEGACQPVVCDGPGPRCIDGDSYTCGANRTQLALAQACDFKGGLFCNGETGECQEFVCEPGLPTCNGELSTRCADDGSRALEVGIDCSATQKVCWAAECLSPICEDGRYQCNDATLLHCLQKGTALATVRECGQGTVCDAEAGTCRLQKCVPTQPACDGDVATTCDSTGLGYIGAAEDCSADGDVCVAGQCVPVICEADATFCEAGELRECGPNGGSFDLLDTCLDSEHCRADLVACVPDVCVAGAPVCDDNALSKCAPDGSGPEPGGTDCGNQVCDRGACRDLVCTPDARFCDSGSVALCNAVGTASAPYQSCAARQHCDAEQPTAAVCSPDVCLQAGNGCSGERLAQCNADGSGFSSVGADCSTTDQVCDLSGSCQAVALDDLSIGATTIPYPDSAIHYGLFYVSTPRTLVQLDAAAAPTVLPTTWVIYRSSTQYGTYNLVDQFSTATAASAGYVSSGAIDISLQGDSFYLLGIAISEAHAVSVLENGAPAPVSFGVLLGGLTYVAGSVPTIFAKLQIGPGSLDDDVALRLRTGP